MSNRRSHQQSPVEDEAALIASVRVKLRDNSILNAQERRFLINFLHKYPKLFAEKRKFDEMEHGPNGVLENTKCKKVQVDLKSTNLKNIVTQTDDHHEPGKAEENERIVLKMKKIAAEDQINKKEVAKLMLKSYTDRRNYILLKYPRIAEVKYTYPLLFSTDEVKNELDRIFYDGKHMHFLDNIKKYSKSILNEKKQESLYQKTMKSVAQCKTEEQKSYAEQVGSVLLVPGIFQEEINFIHLLDNPCKDAVYPYIDASAFKLKELFFDSPIYKVMVEGYLLCEASTLLEALLCLVASFFIFNIDYPPQNERTFIAFEKLYLCADETKTLDEFTDKMVKLLRVQVLK